MMCLKNTTIIAKKLRKSSKYDGEKLLVFSTSFRRDTIVVVQR